MGINEVHAHPATVDLWRKVLVLLHKMLVKFFIDRRGHNPVGEFLDVEKKIKIKATIIIKNIEEFGMVTAIPHIKKLKGLSLWEIRILGKESTRILYAQIVKTEVILLHAFKKKTNKTPQKEINIALNRLKQLA